MPSFDHDLHFFEAWEDFLDVKAVEAMKASGEAKQNPFAVAKLNQVQGSYTPPLPWVQPAVVAS